MSAAKDPLTMPYSKEPITPEMHMQVLPNVLKMPRAKDAMCCDWCSDENPIYAYHATQTTTGYVAQPGQKIIRWMACKDCSRAVDRGDWKYLEMKVTTRFRHYVVQHMGFNPTEMMVKEAVQHSLQMFHDFAVRV